MSFNFAFRGLLGFSFSVPSTQQSVNFSPSVTVSGDSNLVFGADSVNLRFGGQSDQLEIDVSAVTQISAQAVSARVIGLSQSHVFMGMANDFVDISSSVVDPVTGTATAISSSFVSGNSGDDIINIRATGGTVNRWGERAVIFGGAGNDCVFGAGSAMNCYVQLGIGDDQLSIGRHTTNTTTQQWTRPSDGKKMPYGVIRGGGGSDVIHFQHLSQSEFLSAYRPIANVPGGFTLGSDRTTYLEFERVAFPETGVEISLPLTV